MAAWKNAPTSKPRHTFRVFHRRFDEKHCRYGEKHCRIQRSFRGNPRIALALQGKNQSLDEKGVYEALEKSGDNRRGAGGEAELDGAGFARLPKLDRATRKKLQDDLLNGLHVTYHDLCELAVVVGGGGEGGRSSCAAVALAGVAFGMRFWLVMLVVAFCLLPSGKHVVRSRPISGGGVGILAPGSVDHDERDVGHLFRRRLLNTNATAVSQKLPPGLDVKGIFRFSLCLVSLVLQRPTNTRTASPKATSNSVPDK